MDAAPSLRVIGSHGVGVNAIAVKHATALGIPVVNTPDANRASVAEHTIALMLAAAKRIVGARRAGSILISSTRMLCPTYRARFSASSALAASAAKLRPWQNRLLRWTSWWRARPPRRTNCARSVIARRRPWTRCYANPIS
jgi:D-isomer specific 2-hydroxyacid dehydrogenase-like protein